MTHTETIQKKLGFMGRMISGSKSFYCSQYPDRKPIFNANIITSEGKVWYGDLDLVTDKKVLQDIADTLGESIYVLREMDARFGTEEEDVQIMISKAVGIFTALEK